MTAEKKIETLEGELKLLKVEVKQSLADVSDFLKSLKLPLSFKDLDGMDNQLGLKGGLALDSDENLPRSPSEGARRAQKEPPPLKQEEAPAPQGSKGDSVGMNKSTAWDKGTPRREKPLLGLSTPKKMEEAPTEPPRSPEKLVPHMHMEKPKDEAQEDNKPEDNKEDKMREEAVQTSPQVNLLANLIRWVSIARNEIGNEKLRTFLEIYAIGGDLSLELKQVILHLAEVVVVTSEDRNTADVWSRLLLELHGILTGGGTSLRLLSPPAEEEPGDKAGSGDAKGDKPASDKSNRPVRLKLVVPDGNGEKEFDIDEFSVNLD